MRIVSWICAIVAFVGLVVFLGKYAVSINSVPLWIIIVGVLILPAVDVFLSLKDRDSEAEKSEETGS
ncbi:MAG: hypothetical protein R3174_03775 [Gammaproteobacteria bacterium]|nr:hypothetical protein [Gammaproteobacteria bacterium]